MIRAFLCGLEPILLGTKTLFELIWAFLRQWGLRAVFWPIWGIINLGQQRLWRQDRAERPEDCIDEEDYVMGSMLWVVCAPFIMMIFWLLLFAPPADTSTKVICEGDGCTKLMDKCEHVLSVEE